MLKKVIRITLSTSLVIAVLLLSELLYLSKDPKFVSAFYFEEARFLAVRGKTQDAFDTLSKGAKKYRKLTYKNLSFREADFYNEPVYIPDDSKLKIALSLYIKNLDFPRLLYKNSYDISRVFYDLAYLSYKNGSEYLFPRFMEEAVNSNPLEDYLYLELANFYYNYGQTDNSLKALDLCDSNATTRESCQSFKQRIENKDYPFKPGFLMKETEKYYSYPSVITLEN